MDKISKLEELYKEITRLQTENLKLAADKRNLLVALKSIREIIDLVIENLHM